MAKSLSKPQGSKIEEIDDFDGRTYRWKLPDGGLIRVFIAAFLIVWLCGWAVGFVTTALELLKNGGGPDRFLQIWLAGWTVGGIVVMTMLYFLVRPCRPETVTLQPDTFHYDSGTSPPIQLFIPWYGYGMRQNVKDVFGRIFRHRKQIEVPRKELADVVLERIGERQRLYFDHGADRVEIGEHLREPEREWLAEVIKAWKTT